MGLWLFGSALAAGEQPGLIVAQDGSGDYTTIQAAIEAAPADADRPFVILVRRGTYREQLFIKKPSLALVGEDRDSTRIVFALLRETWRADHPDDWGAAAVNIGEGADDLILANLTITNNYGALHGDHGHQFAIRGFDATRTIIVNCTIKADGGDTISLWNKESGMYYHAFCRFEGWVDFVCPRGWCYITHSEFFSHSLTAAIWHDGDRDPRQKLVIRHSSFDGVPGFLLGRNHRDAQFYLLDCTFSGNMADRPIYQARDSTAYQWPDRYYYAGNYREGGDFPWFADNLHLAAGSPTPAQITPGWTFDGMWDPGQALLAVRSFIALPGLDTLLSPSR